jgi:hypothetical protein
MISKVLMCSLKLLAHVITILSTKVCSSHGNTWGVTTILGDIHKGVTTRSRVAHFCEHYSFVSSIEPHRVEEALQDSDWVLAMQGELNNFMRNEV